ncbi:hypothetical protein PAYE108092_17340 [Paracoccus yeei]
MGSHVIFYRDPNESRGVFRVRNQRQNADGNL